MSDVLLMPLIFSERGMPPHRPPDYCINESVTLAQCLCSMTHTPPLAASVISYRAHEDKNANPLTALENIPKKCLPSYRARECFILQL